MIFTGIYLDGFRGLEEEELTREGVFPEVHKHGRYFRSMANSRAGYPTHLSIMKTCLTEASCNDIVAKSSDLLVYLSVLKLDS